MAELLRTRMPRSAVIRYARQLLASITLPPTLGCRLPERTTVHCASRGLPKPVTKRALGSEDCPCGSSLKCSGEPSACNTQGMIATGIDGHEPISRAPPTPPHGHSAPRILSRMLSLRLADVGATDTGHFESLVLQRLPICEGTVLLAVPDAGVDDRVGQVHQ